MFARFISFLMIAAACRVSAFSMKQSLQKHRFYSSSSLKMAQKEATVGMGCFWSPQEKFDKMPGKLILLAVRVIPVRGMVIVMILKIVNIKNQTVKNSKSVVSRLLVDSMFIRLTSIRVYILYDNNNINADFDYIRNKGFKSWI